MQHHLDTPEKREACFAKTMTVNGRQVLAHLQRDDSDRLVIVVQLWVAHTDEQLRAVLTTEADVLTTIMFNDLNEESMPLVLEQAGVDAIIAGIGEQI